ncbi:MAG: hypothetical protein IPO21_14355 [Bacteroidales bacterium]|nr:hypothetical protein [Bacteroidales bacterium]
MRDKNKLSQTSLDRLNGVDDKLIQLVTLAISISPVDFGIAYDGGVRDDIKQKELFDKGYSKKDGIKNKSKHQKAKDGFSKAFDFIPFVNGKPCMDKHYYFMIIAVMFIAADMLNIKIRSGANWDSDNEFITDQTFQDLPHIELL